MYHLILQWNEITFPLCLLFSLTWYQIIFDPTSSSFLFSRSLQEITNCLSWHLLPLFLLPLPRLSLTLWFTLPYPSPLNLTKPIFSPGDPKLNRLLMDSGSHSFLMGLRLLHSGKSCLTASLSQIQLLCHGIVKIGSCLDGFALPSLALYLHITSLVRQQLLSGVRSTGSTLPSPLPRLWRFAAFFKPRLISP